MGMKRAPHLAIHLSAKNTEKLIIVLQNRRPNGTFLKPSPLNNLINDTMNAFDTVHITIDGKVTHAAHANRAEKV